MASDWLPVGDLLEVTSERLESDWEPLLPEGGAWEEESLEGPCEEEERLFCSLSSFLSSSLSLLPSFSAEVFVSFLSGGGEGEEEEDEEELEEDEEDEDLPG